MRYTQILMTAMVAGGAALIVPAASAGQPERFRGMDVNRDGVITRAEWRGNDQAFRRHDTNGDNVLSGDELQRAGDGIVGDFSRVDLDGNGHVTVQEWRRAFQMLDANRDGSLTEDELSSSSRDVVRQDQRSNAFRAGYDRGLTDGRQAGREDGRRRTWDIDGQRELEQADAGYTNAVGPRQEYQAGYRDGFRRGYEEGFGPRR